MKSPSRKTEEVNTTVNNDSNEPEIANVVNVTAQPASQLSPETESTESVVQVDNNKDEDETIDVTFGQSPDESDDEESDKEEDLSNYTVVDADHLMEDNPIKGQEYCLLSFMSPEGIMNCNVRAVKFRGAYPTIKAAEAAAAKLEEQDEYFQIFVGETGKWLDFDPPAAKVEREKTSNPQHQKILDAQAKQRMTKINDLAGKTKQVMDKKRKGKKDMIDEKKKAGAAQETVDKRRNKKNASKEKQNSKEKKSSRSSRPARGRGGRNLEAMKDRMRKRLAEKQNKKRLNNMDKDKDKSKSKSGSNDSNSETVSLDKKIKVVGKASSELESKKAKLEAVDKNIERIKELMEKRRNRKSQN